MSGERRFVVYVFSDVLLDALKFWVDPCGQKHGLDAETEVVLKMAESGRCWSGMFSACTVDCEHAFVRLGLVSDKACSVWFRIEDVDSGQVVLRDGDQMPAGKNWWLGSFEFEERLSPRRDSNPLPAPISA